MQQLVKGYERLSQGKTLLLMLPLLDAPI